MVFNKMINVIKIPVIIVTILIIYVWDVDSTFIKSIENFLFKKDYWFYLLFFALMLLSLFSKKESIKKLILNYVFVFLLIFNFTKIFVWIVNK